jgi:trk system potassium uptake protein
MNIFIAGGGRVGFQLARLLTIDKHDVTVIESDQNQVDHIDYSLDVSTVCGRSQDVLLLQQLGVSEADLFIATTGADEINLIAATTAKGLGAKTVLARVENRMYNESDILYETIMGIDFIISPQALTAHETVNYIQNPGMIGTESFGHGRVQMLQIQVTKAPHSSDESLKDIPLPEGVLIGVLSRDGKASIPYGGSQIETNDTVMLLGEKEGIKNAKHLFQGVEVRNQNVVIMGGSRTGLNLAQFLEKDDHNVTLIEWNMPRCNELASELRKTKVVCRDATSRISLEQENVDNTDIFVAATHDDERNIMASVLAKEVGAKRTVAIVHQPDFAPLVRKLGIDHAVTPRSCIANRVLKLTSQAHSQSLAMLEDGQIEVLEFKLKDEHPLLETPITDIKFPERSLVGTILRNDKVIIPSGKDTFLLGDTVIVIVNEKSIDAIRKLFQL